MALFKPAGLFFISLLALIIFLLQLSLWFGPKNIAKTLVLYRKIQSQEKTIAQLKTRNLKLYKQINNLKAGHDIIEEKARSELGMIKQGERLFLIHQTPQEKSF